jgi:hypothetical protein
MRALFFWKHHALHRFLPFFPSSSSQPLRTPVKQVHRRSSRTALSVVQHNAIPHPISSLNPTTRVGVSTKRKSIPLPNNFSTPLRQHTLTPLNISSAKNSDDASGVVAFDRLARYLRLNSRCAHLKRRRRLMCTSRRKQDDDQAENHGSKGLM